MEDSANLDHSKQAEFKDPYFDVDGNLQNLTPGDKLFFEHTCLDIVMKVTKILQFVSSTGSSVGK